MTHAPQPYQLRAVERMLEDFGLAAFVFARQIDHYLRERREVPESLAAHLESIEERAVENAIHAAHLARRIHPRFREENANGDHQL